MPVDKLLCHYVATNLSESALKGTIITTLCKQSIKVGHVVTEETALNFKTCPHCHLSYVTPKDDEEDTREVFAVVR